MKRVLIHIGNQYNYDYFYKFLIYKLIKFNKFEINIIINYSFKNSYLLEDINNLKKKKLINKIIFSNFEELQNYNNLIEFKKIFFFIDLKNIDIFFSSNLLSPGKKLIGYCVKQNSGKIILLTFDTLNNFIWNKKFLRSNNNSNNYVTKIIIKLKSPLLFFNFFNSIIIRYISLLNRRYNSFKKNLYLYLLKIRFKIKKI